MLVLLPPSETKFSPERGRAIRAGDLSFQTLRPARETVRKRLAQTSSRPDAASLLKVPAGAAGEIQRNTRLEEAPSARVDRIYTGVLFDALSLQTLEAGARRWANTRMVIVSALYGAVRPTDRIAPYRLSMAVNLPGLGGLAGFWRPHLAQTLGPVAGKRGLILDARSSTYIAAWRPGPELIDRWVSLEVPGATHNAKHTRGVVARAVAEHRLDPRSPAQAAEGLRALGFEVELYEPERRHAPWRLAVTARA